MKTPGPLRVKIDSHAVRRREILQPLPPAFPLPPVTRRRRDATRVIGAHITRQIPRSVITIRADLRRRCVHGVPTPIRLPFPPGQALPLVKMILPDRKIILSRLPSIRRAGTSIDGMKSVIPIAAVAVGIVTPNDHAQKAAVLPAPHAFRAVIRHTVITHIPRRDGAHQVVVGVADAVTGALDVRQLLGVDECRQVIVGVVRPGRRQLRNRRRERLRLRVVARVEGGCRAVERHAALGARGLRGQVDGVGRDVRRDAERIGRARAIAGSIVAVGGRVAVRVGGREPAIVRVVGGGRDAVRFARTRFGLAGLVAVRVVAKRVRDGDGERVTRCDDVAIYAYAKPFPRRVSWGRPSNESCGNAVYRVYFTGKSTPASIVRSSRQFKMP